MTTPYRDGKKLDAVIPPDRRRQRAIMLVVVGMLAGALVYEGLRAWLVEETKPKLVALTGPTVVLDSPSLPGPISGEEVSTVVGQHKADLRDRCFMPRTEIAKATVYIDIVIAKSGEVLSSHYEGTDARVTECVDREVRQWRFPAHARDSATTRIPFFFERT